MWGRVTVEPASEPGTGIRPLPVRLGTRDTQYLCRAFVISGRIKCIWAIAPVRLAARSVTAASVCFLRITFACRNVTSAPAAAGRSCGGTPSGGRLRPGCGMAPAAAAKSGAGRRTAVRPGRPTRRRYASWTLGWIGVWRQVLAQIRGASRRALHRAEASAAALRSPCRPARREAGRWTCPAYAGAVRAGRAPLSSSELFSALAINRERCCSSQGLTMMRPSSGVGHEVRLRTAMRV